MTEWLSIFFQGLRFDSTWATVSMLLSWFCITLPAWLLGNPRGRSLEQIQLVHQRVVNWRRWWGGLLTGFILIMSLISLGYFREYHDLFNEFLFGLIFDDTSAIFKTIWKSYPLFQYLGLFVLVMLGYWYVLCPWLWSVSIGHRRKSGKFSLFESVPKSSLWRSALWILVFMIFVVAGFRGGLGPRPMQLKDAAVSRESVLNKAVLNPLTALRYAIKQHCALNGGQGLGHWIMGGESQLAKTMQATWQQTRQSVKEAESVAAHPDVNIDESLQKTVAQAHSKQPKQVFLMVMESYDNWPMQPAYDFLHVADGLKSLGAEGLYFPNFISASHGTMSSLAAIISGLPDAQVVTNYQRSAKMPYPSGVATIFKRLGYKTRLFYGGYLSWQRIEDFARDQGFDEVYGASHIANWLATNEWGVDDKSLFEFIEMQYDPNKADEDTPTFNLILSTSNHPPFSVDLKPEGFDEADMARRLVDYPHGSATAKTLGHFWYADRCLTDFVRNLAIALPDSVFAITGDHFSRRHILPNPSSFESTSVPLVLYGPKVLAPFKKRIHPETVAGGHLDIAPTLIEMAAPAGFTYPSFGKNLLDPQASKNAEHNVGLGNQAVMLPKQQVLLWPEMEDWDPYYRQAMGLAWWRITQGAVLKK